MIAGNVGAGDGATMITSAPVISLRPVLTAVQDAGGLAPKGKISISSFPFEIGRTEGSLIIKEPNISRRHAQITYDDAKRVYYITDLNSSNGTRLNEQRLTPGQAAQLVSGVVIGLGPNISLRFDLI
jgi:pSer/pThr/pTyr-binding forkhead associated (FHA) protein